MFIVKRGRGCVQSEMIPLGCLGVVGKERCTQLLLSEGKRTAMEVSAADFLKGLKELDFILKMNKCDCGKCSLYRCV